MSDQKELLAWANKFRSIPDPELTSEAGREIWRIGSEYIELTLRGIESETEEL